MLSVIVVNYNGEDVITHCIASLKRHISINFQILVVDNDSDDKSTELISVEHPDVTLIRSPENIGFGKANNLAVDQACYDNILLINSDCILVENISSLINLHFEKNNSIGSCKVIFPNGRLQYTMGNDIHPFLYSVSWLPFLGKKISRVVTKKESYNFVSEPDWLSGVFLMLKKQDFLDVGGFNPNYFMYMEDLDLCRSLKTKKSYVCCYYPDFKVSHLLMGGKQKNRGAAIINTANSYIVFFNRYYSKRVANLALLMIAIVFIIRFFLELPKYLLVRDATNFKFLKAAANIFKAF
jgi:hypothetical protein